MRAALSIRQQLTRVTLLAALTALATASVSFFLYDVIAFRRDTIRRLSSMAELVGLNSTSALLFGDVKAAAETLAALRAEPHVRGAAVYGRDGKLFATYRRPGRDETFAPPLTAVSARTGHRFTGSALEVIEPIHFEGATIGVALIESDLGEIRERLVRYAWIAALVLGVSLLLALLGSGRLQQGISRPILDLARTARRVSLEKDYTVRAQPHPGEEIGLLVRTFNDMLQQIQQRDAEVSAVAAENARLYREAQEANRLKDEFLATLSHELRTPLNAIVGWTQILRERAQEGAVLERGLRIIDRNAHTQSRLIEDILDVSRIVSGKLHLTARRVDLQAVVEAALEAVRPAANAKEIRVESQIERVPPVWGDPDRLQQVAWNLLSNAIKFTAPGGWVRLVVAPAAAGVSLSVEDSGIGIPPEFLPHVFERFRQADASTTRQHGGLGLGLAIVKHLVELHGGTVSARSDGAGKGATFQVLLPVRSVPPAEPAREAREPREAAARPGAAADGGLRGLRVLVVDDEPDARELVLELLNGVQAIGIPASSGEEALALLARERPDVLLCDIGMPGMDGFELIRRVRSMRAEAGGLVPAAAVTAYARSEDRVEALNAGFQIHLSKPIQPSELLAVLASLARHG